MLDPVPSNRDIREFFSRAVAVVVHGNGLMQVFFANGALEEARRAAALNTDLTGWAPELSEVQNFSVKDESNSACGDFPFFYVDMKSRSSHALVDMMREQQLPALATPVPQKTLEKVLAQHSHTAERYEDNTALFVSVAGAKYGYVVFWRDAGQAATHAIARLTGDYLDQCSERLEGESDKPPFHAFFVHKHSPEYALLRNSKAVAKLYLNDGLEMDKVTSTLRINELKGAKSPDLLRGIRRDIAGYGTVQGIDVGYLVFDPAKGREARRVLDACGVAPGQGLEYVRIPAPDREKSFTVFPMVCVPNDCALVQQVLASPKGLHRVHSDISVHDCFGKLTRSLQQRALAYAGQTVGVFDSHYPSGNTRFR